MLAAGPQGDAGPMFYLLFASKWRKDSKHIFLVLFISNLQPLRFSKFSKFALVN